MKFLLATLALLGLASAASAEQYQCTSDTGCTARITVDGVVEEHAFRKGDIVDTGSGWDVGGSCCEAGWVKVKTTDSQSQKPPHPPAGATSSFVVDDRLAGTTVTVGNITRTYVSARQLLSGGGGSTGTSGDTYKISWKSDSDGPAGPEQPVTVTVETEKNQGESIREHARRHAARVEAMKELFPPNVPDQTP